MTTKAELLADIENKWTSLNTVLVQLTDVQLTTVKDAAGWTVKDHITHLAAWLRSVVFFLQGKPRHAGLGVDEDLYLNGGYERINTTIQQQQQHLAVSEAMAQLQAAHRQLLEQLQLLTNADLQRRYRYFLPDEPGDGDGPVALDLIAGNSAEHFAEHLGWIEALIGQKP